MELLRQPEMDLGEVNEHGHIGPALADGPLELSELAVDARQMTHHLSEAHDRHVFRADDALDSGGLHARPAHPEELRSFSFWSEILRERSSASSAP